MVWIRARKFNCIPQILAEVRVSDLEANPDRMYYKCKFYKLFKWVVDSKLIKVGRESFNIHEDYIQLKGVFKYYLVLYSQK